MPTPLKLRLLPKDTSDPADDSDYQVSLLGSEGEPQFVGGLSDLAAALRSGELAAPQIPLLELTLAVLTWLREHPALSGGPLPSEALPALAAVIALKARLLLPAQTATKDSDLASDWAEDWPESLDDPSEDTLEGLEALAELGRAVQFLSQRRAERSGLIPAPVPRPALELPRRTRAPKQNQNLRRLLEAARAAVREVEVPLLARERLSLQGAMTALLAFGRRLQHFTFGGITVQDWGERTTYFAALLEAMKTGELQAEQTEIYGEINIELGAQRSDG